MTCLSCRYSVRLASGLLWCARERKGAITKCKQFTYEPGTDEGRV